MKNNLIKIKQNAIAELEKIKNLEVFEKLQTKYLGRKSELSEILKSLAELKEDKRKAIGKIANEAKSELEELFKTKQEELEKVFSPHNIIDPTLPGEKIKSGHLHPITLIQNDLEQIFKSMGFMVATGPELETDFYNFTALNVPADHPARDMQDTFYIKDKKGEKSDFVMRTHTSPVQVRTMQKYGAPLRCVAPGRVFRCEATDAVHEHTFYQLEGLVVDKNVSIANMISVLSELLDGIFGEKMETRIRPGYFPFVEPAIEIDIKCTICKGEKCPACKHSGWLEVLPAGMVHPEVLKHGGLDPKEWNGFAFGLGMTRLAMMKYKIKDIRHFQSGNLKFLEQF